MSSSSNPPNQSPSMPQSDISLDELLSTLTPEFRDWLEPHLHRYIADKVREASHVQGRRITCLNKQQIQELLKDCTDIDEVKARVEAL